MEVPEKCGDDIPNFTLVGADTPEGRAKLAANMKARWAARKAGKPAAKVGNAAKKGFKLPKKA